MTYLVTGAAGFIGARFVEECNFREIPVVSVDSHESFKRAEHEGLDFGLKIPRDHIRYWLYRERPELSAIIHLGACTNTTEMDIDYLIRTNSMYSQQLWEFATYNRIPFIYASNSSAKLESPGSS